MVRLRTRNSKTAILRPRIRSVSSSPTSPCLSTSSWRRISCSACHFNQTQQVSPSEQIHRRPLAQVAGGYQPVPSLHSSFVIVISLFAHVAELGWSEEDQ